jgi:hypothetical protein
VAGLPVFDIRALGACILPLVFGNTQSRSVIRRLALVGDVVDGVDQLGEGQPIRAHAVLIRVGVATCDLPAPLGLPNPGRTGLTPTVAGHFDRHG